ncbi:hypothetical protein EZV62_000473 [Acer yangbiense]|uniref:RNase H type-1 domain-containing protein n=1 Tax=Acer yangbiense TaxID=1000413 RepID=A0A5C7IST2_9ROSI|nr:hypothetical protein EZV62_000473 [Acer yangbiense]
MLNRGSRRRIGDGNDTLIYEDQWLPMPSTFKVCSPKRLPDASVVSTLIESPGKWNESLIRRNFLPEEAELILSIPLSVYLRRDSFLWHFNKDGTFTVKSAYRVAISAMKRFEAFCSSALCPLCREGPETVEHALWRCKSVKPEWNHCPLFSDLNKLKIDDFLGRVIWVASVANLENVVNFITTAWLVWNNRNQSLFREKAKCWGDSWTKATLFLSGGKTIETQNNSSAIPSLVIKNWIPPSFGTIKVNVDAALDVGRNKFSVGIVIRDSSGRILKSAALVFNGRTSTDIAEAKVIYEGLLLATSSGLQPLSIESDSLNVVRLCNGEISTRNDVFNVICDIQFLLSRERKTSISYIPRSCNRVAHEVARRAIGLENSVIMYDPYPIWLQKLALSDVLLSFSFVE